MPYPWSLSTTPDVETVAVSLAAYSMGLDPLFARLIALGEHEAIVEIIPESGLLLRQRRLWNLSVPGRDGVWMTVVIQFQALQMQGRRLSARFQVRPELCDRPVQYMLESRVESMQMAV